MPARSATQHGWTQTEAENANPDWAPVSDPAWLDSNPSFSWKLCSEMACQRPSMVGLKPDVENWTTVLQEGQRPSMVGLKPTNNG
jgi:hypothetical protein